MAITTIDPTEPLSPPEGQPGKFLSYTADIDQLSLVISNVIGFFTLIAGFAFLFYFAFAAITMITSGDDQQKLTNARKNMTQALVGIAIVSATYPLVWLLTHLLGIPLINPTKMLNSYLTFK
jgi:arginine exporter protein ArgO